MAKKLSPAMFAWAKANKSKLKQPTKSQKKIFAQYDAMVKAGDNPANPKPRPKAAPKASPKVAPKSVKTNASTSRDGNSGTGTDGSGRPSNKPAVKSKPTPTRHRGGQRSRPGNREVIKAKQEKRRQGAREVSNRARLANPGVSLPMRPAANPSKGHRYKKPFGPIMVYDGTKYVRAN